MPIKKGLIKLYNAKAIIMEALVRQVQEVRRTNVNQTVAGKEVQNIKTYKSPSGRNVVMPCEALWLAVIDRAIFDAYLHSTGGDFQSVIWVKDARAYFSSRRFRWVCEQLGINVDWVRSLIYPLERLARNMRGKEYDEAVVVSNRNGEQQCPRITRTKTN